MFVRGKEELLMSVCLFVSESSECVCLCVCVDGKERNRES